MKPAQRWLLLLGLGLLVIGKGTVVAQTAAADSPPAPSLTLTIHVHDYAEVDAKTLAKAKSVATGTFLKLGVRTQWADSSPMPESKQDDATYPGRFSPSNIELSILPRSMAERFGLPSNVMGFAPGPERDAQRMFVFYNRVENLAHSQVRAPSEGGTPATTAQVLGHAIAHELGHILLNIQSHSASGIMRGNWNAKDLQDICYGKFGFTSQQAEAIRAEVSRRITEHETIEVASR
jgi:hypothetical protein